MSDENDIAEEATTNGEAEGPVCGERLAEARRKLQISVFEIAKELHLDDFKVRALESNEFVPDLKQIEAHLQGADMMFFGNPNNPTGIAVPADS